jgi:hypothetical protein
MSAFRRVLFLLLFGFLVSPSPGQTTGKDWASHSQDWRLEFLAGYLDCSIAERKDKNKTVAWTLLEPKITNYYLQPSADAALPVTSLIDRFAPESRNDNPDGEYYPEKHGFFDGEYWYQISSSDARAGFISGYLTCQRAEPKRKVDFLKSPDSYANRISDWYNPNGSSQKLADHRANTKIADVLYRFASKPVAH